MNDLVWPLNASNAARYTARGRETTQTNIVRQCGLANGHRRIGCGPMGKSYGGGIVE